VKPLVLATLVACGAPAPVKVTLPPAPKSEVAPVVRHRRPVDDACIEEARAQLVTIRRMAAEHRNALRVAVERNDEDEARHHRAVLSVLASRAAQIAQSCAPDSTLDRR
jgi:hypothetical protein